MWGSSDTYVVVMDSHLDVSKAHLQGGSLYLTIANVAHSVGWKGRVACGTDRPQPLQPRPYLYLLVRLPARSCCIQSSWDMLALHTSRLLSLSSGLVSADPDWGAPGPQMNVLAQSLALCH